MGVLVFLFFVCIPLRAEAALPENPPIDIIYDAGNPDASVGIIAEDVLEVGAFYDDYEIVAFEPEAIILKDEEAEDFLKWPKEGTVSSKALERGLRFFIVKQMRAIDAAQHLYLEKFHDGYAESISALIDQGFLPDGFQEDRKQNYTFRIIRAGLGKRRAIEAKRLPEFFAVAEPIHPEKDPWFFGVDQLGQVRYAKSLRGVTWGPVWEYNGLNEALPSTVITYED